MRTVKQVSEASGVSIRALHHYDHIGLLKPDVGLNGYRYYGQEEMLRLQHILFYRELGVPLVEIARILDDPTFDTRAALRALRRRIEQEINQRHDLAKTIDETLASLESGSAIKDRSLFNGISASKQAEWEAQIVTRWGEGAREAIQEARKKMEGATAAQLLDFKEEIDAVHSSVVGLIRDGGTPSSSAARTLMERHYRWVCRSWTPDAQAYSSLGHMYVEHPEFRTMFDTLHPRMAEFMAQAMAFYARTAFEGEMQ